MQYIFLKKIYNVVQEKIKVVTSLNKRKVYKRFMLNIGDNQDFYGLDITRYILRNVLNKIIEFPYLRQLG